MVTKSTNTYYIYDLSDPRVAQGVLEEAGRAKAHIITEAAPNELKLVGVRRVMRADHRQGGDVGGCSSGVICENHLVGSEVSEGMRAHATHFSSIRWGSL